MWWRKKNHTVLSPRRKFSWEKPLWWRTHGGLENELMLRPTSRMKKEKKLRSAITKDVDDGKLANVSGNQFLFLFFYQMTPFFFFYWPSTLPRAAEMGKERKKKKRIPPKLTELHIFAARLSTKEWYRSVICKHAGYLFRQLINRPVKSSATTHWVITSL